MSKEDAAWDDAEKTAEKHSGSGKFVSLKNDGDKVVGAFVGAPHTKELYYDQTSGQYEDFTEAHRKAGKKVTLRVSINMYVIRENDEKVEPSMKVIEGGVKWFKSVLKNKKKYGLDKKFFEIERNGAKGDPKTTYTVLPDEDITEEHLKAMRAMDLNDLESTGETSDEAPGDDDFGSYDAAKKSKDDPISADDAAKLTAALRQRPREDIDKFLSKFGIKRVKELKNGDLENATAFIKSFDEPEAAASAEDENDPFS